MTTKEVTKQAWRKASKKAMRKAASKQLKRKGLDDTFDYRWEHVQAVVDTAVKLAHQVGGDVEIVEAAAWLHDIRKEARDNHPKEGAKFAREFLPKTDFPPEKIERVAQAIADHIGLWRDKPLKNLESQILWDADKLTKMGATAIFHWVGNWLTKGSTATTRGMIENGRSVDWMHKTVKSMHTKPARRAAKKRYKRFKKIWDELEMELNGEDLGNGEW